MIREAQAFLQARGDVPSERSREAWEWFYRNYHPLICELARGRALPGASAEDAVQEVWKVLVQRLPAFRYDPARGNIRSWVMRLTHNVLTDFVRRLRRRATEPLSPAVAEWISGREPDPSTAGDLPWGPEAVHAALDALKARVAESTYQVFFLHEIEGLAFADVAARLGLTPEEARCRNRRARAKLRGLVGRHLARPERADGS